MGHLTPEHVVPSPLGSFVGFRVGGGNDDDDDDESGSEESVSVGS